MMLLITRPDISKHLDSFSSLLDDLQFSLSGIMTLVINFCLLPGKQKNFPKPKTKLTFLITP